jgi:hypothetical protein
LHDAVRRDQEENDMIQLPTWMRRALLATAVMNVFAAGAFLPSAGAIRALAGLPDDAHPFYLATIAMFVLLFGLGYLWSGATGHADRLFIAIAAIGKISFFVLLVGFWSVGQLSPRAPLLGSADLFFGVLFVIWLSRSGSAVTAELPAGGAGNRPLAARRR